MTVSSVACGARSIASACGSKKVASCRRAERRAPRRRRPLRSLEDDDFRRRPALRWAHCSLRHRGPINGEWFRTYVEKVLAPTLRPGDSVILDNPSSRKVAGVRATVEARGARLLCLPPYSPDLNRSSSSSPSSRHSCARPPPELSRPSGQPSRAAARMKAWTRRPAAINLDTIAGCALLAIATALLAPLRVRCECGARGDTCGWRLSSCADCVNLSVFVSCCGALRGAQCRRAPQSCGNRIPTNSCLC